MDTLHLAVTADTIYFFVITNFGDPTVILRDTPWCVIIYPDNRTAICYTLVSAYLQEYHGA